MLDRIIDRLILSAALLAMSAGMYLAMRDHYSRPVNYAVQLIPTERCPACDNLKMFLREPFGMANGRLVMSCKSDDLLGYKPKQPLDCVVISRGGDVMASIKGASLKIEKGYTKEQVLSRIKILQWANLDLWSDPAESEGTGIF